MLEFYRENVKYFFKILYYKHIILLFVVLPLVVIVSGGVLFFLSKFDQDLFNIVFFCTLTSLLLLVIGGLLWNFLFITVYSLLKEEQDDRVFTKILYDIYGSLTNWKTLLIIFASFLGIATLSALLYLYVVPNVELYQIIKVALVREIELIITALILFVILKRAAIWKIILHIIETLRGILRIAFIAAIGLVGLLALAGIFWIVSLIFDPILNPIFGIVG